MAKIIIQNTDVTIISINDNDYISITDIAKHKSDDPTAVIGNWMRNRNTIEYLGVWESLYNPLFKPTEFEGFKKEAGLNAFTMSPQKWVNATVYANEADVLNVAMFGITAKQWREAHPDLKGNIRDYATINELICLSNMENLNAVFIKDGLSQRERLIKLNQIAIHQMQILQNNKQQKYLK